MKLAVTIFVYLASVATSYWLERGVCRDKRIPWTNGLRLEVMLKSAAYWWVGAIFMVPIVLVMIPFVWLMDSLEGWLEKPARW